MTNWYILKTAVDVVSLLLRFVVLLRPLQYRLLSFLLLTHSSSTFSAPSHHQVVTAWICRLIASTKLPEAAVAPLLDAASRMLRVPSNRSTFSQHSGLDRLALLVDRFRTDVAVLYKIGLCLWLLSFDDDVAREFSGPPTSNSPLLATICDVLRNIMKEKVQRVFLACAKNLVKLGNSDLNEELIDLGLLRTVNKLAAVQHDDEDLADDVNFLVEKLQSNFKEYTTFEKYQKEVLGGKLEWTPSHTSESFWRENINAFEQRDFELIRYAVVLYICFVDTFCCMNSH